MRKAALDRFRESGFDATNVADIARDAGVTERTFYGHFPSKEAVLFQDHEDRMEWFAAALARPPRPPPPPVLVVSNRILVSPLLFARAFALACSDLF